MPESIGERVRRLREALELTQREFAIKVGSGYTPTVSRWETSTTTPSRSQLHLIASLTRTPEKVFLWLVQGGAEPKLLAAKDDKKLSSLGTLLATPPALPPESVLIEDGRTQHMAFSAFMKRVVSLAAAGKLIRAHHLIEWATMLVRTSDLLSLVTKRVTIILKELPILVLELDGKNNIFGYHTGKLEGQENLDHLLLGRSVAEIIPQIPPTDLWDAIERARVGEDSEIAYTIPFKDKSRGYVARLYFVGDEHVMLFVHRANETRADELGIRERLGIGH